MLKSSILEFLLTHLPFKIIVPFCRKIKNLLSRPSLEIKLEQCIFEFEDSNTVRNNITYFCLKIFNKTSSSFHINLGSILINNNSYQVFIQSDSYFSKLDKQNSLPWKCNSEMLHVYKDHWSEISSSSYDYYIDAKRTYQFPMNPIKENSHPFTSIPKDSLLFCAKGKIGVTLELDKKIYAYGYDRKKCYEALINFLAFYNETR